MTDLIDHLLGQRHRIPNGVIIDCLAIARLQPTPEQRFPIACLQEVMECNTQSGLSLRLTKLKQYGLLEYQRGHRGAPGYRITRIGPA